MPIYLCNVDLLTPNFYKVKLEFTGVYILLLFLLKNIDCEYSLEPPQDCGYSLRVPTIYVLRKNKKNINFLYKIIIFAALKIAAYCIGMFAKCITQILYFVHRHLRKEYRDF